MTRILANPALLVALLGFTLAGDAFRDGLGVPVWIGLVVAAFGWSVAVLATAGRSWRDLPLPIVATYAWWVVSPAWSPYAATSVGMVVSALVTASIAVAFTRVFTAESAVRLGALALRWILGLSLGFETVVAVLGHPVYPVGLTVTSATPIESAWSRGELFALGARIQGIVGNANVLGMIGLVALIVAVVRFVATRSGRRWVFVDVVLASVIVARTASATVTLALVGVVIVVVVAALARRKGTGSRVALAGALVAILSGIAVAVARWGEVTALLGKSPDLTHRFDIWAAVGERIATSPLIGHGYVGWWPTWEPWFAIDVENGLRVAQAHNLWFDLVLQTGIVGALLAASVIGYTLVMLGREFLAAPRSLVAIPFLLLVALTVQSLTESRLLHEWGAISLVAFAIVARRLSSTTTSKR